MMPQTQCQSHPNLEQAIRRSESTQCRTTSVDSVQDNLSRHKQLQAQVQAQAHTRSQLRVVCGENFLVLGLGLEDLNSRVQAAASAVICLIEPHDSPQFFSRWRLKGARKGDKWPVTNQKSASFSVAGGKRVGIHVHGDGRLHSARHCGCELQTSASIHRHCALLRQTTFHDKSRWQDTETGMVGSTAYCRNGFLHWK